MRRALLSPAAQADLDAIWNYTATQWGTGQAADYVRDIRDACAALARGERLSRPADEIRAGYRRCLVGAHVLFFRVTPAGDIEIVRILHQRMDVNRHL